MKTKLAMIIPAGLVLAIAVAPLGAYAAGPKFQNAVPSYSLGSSTIVDLAFADLNGDGHQDAVFSDAANDRIAIMKGNGDGTFQPTPSYAAVGSSPREIAVANLNADAYPDLAIANYSSDTVSILLGRSDGTFEPQVAYAAGAGPVGVCAVDLDEDGYTDLAIAANDNHSLSILYGNGDGTFAAPESYPTGTYPRYIVAGDFDRDGHPDLAVTNSGSASISVMLNGGNRTFATTSTYGGVQTPTKLVSGDFNGDTFLDLATADNGNSGGAAILLGSGDGSFATAVLYSSGSNTHPLDIAKGDFDGDGHSDLAVMNQNGTLSIFNGNADGTFQPKSDLPVSGYLGSGDWNEDGLSDLAYAASSGTIHLLTSRAEGELAFSSAAFSVLENGGSASVTVTRTGSSYGQTKVRIQTTDDTALAGTDYTAVDATIVFNPGETTKSYAIPIVNDSVHGSDRSFGVTISGPTNEATLGAQASATVTIQEDDPAPDTTAPVVDPAKFAAVDNYSGTPDQLAGAAGAVGELGAIVRAYLWNDADTDGVVDAGELGTAIALGTSAADGAVPAADIGDLGPGTYKYVVTAADAVGNESARTAVAVVGVTLTKGMTPDTAAPTWPIGASLDSSNVAPASVKLTWPAADDDRGVDHYELTQDGATIASPGAAALSYDVAGLTADTAYGFSVVAIDAAGNRSAPLTSAVTTLPVPTTPSQTPEPSGEARLKLLSLTAGEQPVALTPAFNADAFAYAGATTEARVSLNAEPLSPAAVILVNGESAVGKLPLALDLQPGNNAIAVMVKAANGSSLTYNLTIERQDKPPAASCFVDIRGHWAEAEINEACALGLVQGDPDGLFRPDRAVTRAEWTVMIARALRLGGEDEQAPAFADADRIASWARGPVASATAQGIVRGYPDGTFRPSAAISRAETAALVARAANWTTDAAAVIGFADDASIPPWAKPYVAAAVEHRVMTGTAGNRFEPDASATRAEAAAMLVRLLELFSLEE